MSEPEWKHVICDCETDGLLDTCSKVWCVSYLDIPTKQVKSFYEGGPNGSPYESPHKDLANKVETFVGHNFIHFDRVVFDRFLGIRIEWPRIRDTLVLSRLFNVKREGGHSLENFGKLLGCHKREHEDWSCFSEDMLKRCEQDVRLNYKVREFLLREGRGFSRKSIELEHHTQYILEEMRDNGFYLDERKAHELLSSCSSRADDIKLSLSSYFPPTAKSVRQVIPKYTKDGKLSVVGLKFLGESWQELVGGPFTRIEWVPFNLDSPAQIVTRLNGCGWKPTVFNKVTDKNASKGAKVGSPKVCEENLMTVPDTAPEGVRKLAEYSMLQSRRELIEGWFNALGKDGRVHGTCISTGAITHRMAHRNPNMANIPTSGSPLGDECRACFTVDDPERRTLVGVDLAAIQLRVLAHYINDPEYTNEVVNGDIHTKNMELTGGMIKERKDAKTFIYAWLLGAGKAKLGSIIGGSSKDGELLNDRFLSSLPGLKTLKQVTTKSAAERGFMVGFDGRRIPVKSHHFALSSYLQGGEVVVMKEVICRVHDLVKSEGKDCKLVGVIHDETQWDCAKEDAQWLSDTMLRTIVEVGEYFDLKCPLKGESKIGRTWHDTH